MGKIQKRSFQLSPNASLRIDFQGSRVTSDGGLILERELDERLGFGELAAECLTDARAKNGREGMKGKVNQAVSQFGSLPGLVLQIHNAPGESATGQADSKLLEDAAPALDSKTTVLRGTAI
jgi:hypothetical protein